MYMTNIETVPGKTILDCYGVVSEIGRAHV